MAKDRIFNLLYKVLRIIVPVGLIAWLLTRVDWDELQPVLQGLSWPWMVAALLALFCAYFPAALRWRYLLRVKQIELPYLQLWKIILISLFVSNFLPTTIGGDIIKVAGVVRGARAQKKLAGASVLADRLYNMAPMVFLLPASLSILSGAVHLGPLFGQAKNGAPLYGLVLPPFLKKALAGLKSAWIATRDWFLRPDCFAYSLAMSFAANGFGILAFWCVMQAVGMGAGYWQAMAVIVISYYFALLPISINGLGVQESTIALLLSGAGATSGQAVAAAFLMRLVSLAVSLAGAVVLMTGDRSLLQAARQEQDMQPGKEQISS